MQQQRKSAHEQFAVIGPLMCHCNTHLLTRGTVTCNHTCLQTYLLKKQKQYCCLIETSWCQTSADSDRLLDLCYKHNTQTSAFILQLIKHVCTISYLNSKTLYSSQHKRMFSLSFHHAVRALELRERGRKAYTNT